MPKALREAPDRLQPIDVAVVRIKLKDDWFGAAGLQCVGPEGLCDGKTGAGLGIVELLVAQWLDDCMLPKVDDQCTDLLSLRVGFIVASDS